MKKIFTIAIITAAVSVAAARADDEMPIVDMENDVVMAEIPEMPVTDVAPDVAPEPVVESEMVPEPEMPAPVEVPEPISETMTESVNEPASADVASINVDACEEISVGSDGDVLLKCPKFAGLEYLQRQKADTTFASVADKSSTADKQRMMADKEHMYINARTGDDCPSGAAYRVLVKNIIYTGKNLYAVKYCSEN
ncbi:MAG: hypothetical protein IJ560_03700 [Alphaproteobacteria bacterium]|nr:hypothetical protein [Alphaproteobacteria bacterium]